MTVPTSNQVNYIYWQNMDLWTFQEAAYLLCNVEPKIYGNMGYRGDFIHCVAQVEDFISASIVAGTLEIDSRHFKDSWGFRPQNIIEWAINKDFALSFSVPPMQFVDWYNKQNQPASKAVPTYLDITHPLHSAELSIAISAWEAVLQSNPDKPKTGSRKKLIEDWLKINHDKLNQSAIERITTMLNPDKTGGAPKTE